MLKIRLVGTKEETAKAVNLLRELEKLRLLEVSDYYANRGDSLLGRVYVDADIIETQIKN